MPKLLFIIWLLFVLNIGGAIAVPIQPVTALAPALQTDSSKVSVRQFDKKALQQYALQKDFKYNETPVQGLSVWDRFWRWVWHLIGNIIGKISLGKTTWLLFRIGLFIVAALALAFIIFKILGIDIVKLLRGESQNIAIPYGEALENIHDVNFDDEIEQAIINKNYRKGVRLLYLRSLKQLSDAQLIHWQSEKTNSSYLSELSTTPYHQLFSLLTTQFEYIWYGDFPIDGQTFQNINALFIDFKKGLP